MDEVKSKWSIIFFIVQLLHIPVAVFAGFLGISILLYFEDSLSLTARLLFFMILIFVALYGLFSTCKDILNMCRIRISPKEVSVEYIFLQKENRIITLSEVDNYAYYWAKYGGWIELLKNNETFQKLDMQYYSNVEELREKLPWPQKEPKARNGIYNSR